MDDFESDEDDGDNGLGRENLPAVVGETAIVPAFIAAAGEHAGAVSWSSSPRKSATEHAHGIRGRRVLVLRLGRHARDRRTRRY